VNGEWLDGHGTTRFDGVWTRLRRGTIASRALLRLPSTTASTVSERSGRHRRGAWTVQRIGEGAGDGTCSTARRRKARGESELGQREGEGSASDFIEERERSEGSVFMAAINGIRINGGGNGGIEAPFTHGRRGCFGFLETRSRGSHWRLAVGG
jgi:hypothetical protein